MPQLHFSLALAALSFGLVVPSCTSQEDDDAPVDMRAATSDVIRQSAPILEPTRPEGGFVRGRLTPIGAEENAARVARNKKEPIIWGEAAAGITTATQYIEGLDILAEPLGTSQGFHFYNENVRIAWGGQGKRTPQSIIIDVGYLGALKLPTEFGEVRLGDSFKSRFPPSDPMGKGYIRALARAFEKMGPDFDCFVINVCNVIIDADFIEFSFRNGSMIFTNDDVRELRFVYFLPNLPPLTQPLNQPLVFGTSAGGVSMTMMSHQIKGILGNPSHVNGAFSYYDNGNLAIAWDASSKPLMFFIDRGYQGSWELPAPLGVWRLNSDKSDHFKSSDPNGIALLKTLGRSFDGKETDPAYDCQLVNSCRVTVDFDGTIEFVFDRGGVIFDNSPERRLAGVYYTRPQPPRTEPMTAHAVNFPTGAAGIDMNTPIGTALSALGSPRRVSGQTYYFDNDNILIVWGSEEPRLPLFLQVNKGHRGLVNLPTGNVQMGADMSVLLEDRDALIKEWGRDFLGQSDPGYDCLVQKTCAIQMDETLIFFLFKGKGFIAFNKSSKELSYIGFDSAQEVAME